MTSRFTIVAFAGLPGTGKSTIARELAAQIGAPLFDKDRVREALFGPRHVTYTRAQDDLCTRMCYDALEHVAASSGVRVAVLDGRTYTQRGQVAELLALANLLGAALVWVECVASHEAVRERLAQDALAGTHPARDRTFERYLELEAAAEPLPADVLRIDTSRTPLPACVAACRARIGRSSAS